MAAGLLPPRDRQPRGGGPDAGGAAAVRAVTGAGRETAVGRETGARPEAGAGAEKGAWPEAGRVGPYRLWGRLGVGAGGSVFVGQARGRGRLVAVKALHGGAEGLGERVAKVRELLAESEVAARCFPAVDGAEAAGERPWVASELVDEPGLEATVVSAGPWPVHAVRALGAALAAGLAAAHRVRLVHGGVRPSHVRVTEDGPRLLDLGTSDLETGVSTRVSDRLRAYTAPEQLAGHRPTPYADVFALAGVLVFALSGHPPSEQESDGRAVRDPALRRLLTRCRSHTLTDRPTAAELSRLLLPDDVDAPPFSALLPPSVREAVARRRSGGPTIG
ncbi:MULTISPECIES: protein kinase domain-containing protein [unclassified Streptomyces]|uniref:protein kinase domain-containing protein n=1 Tax=unclassified Streptomyces TaxID=2593676 RepID=UPI002DDB581B|nr:MULTISPECIES: hypothetical protein [unclassified Streptomyces]WSB76740.1 hypothetical protein OHB04_13755 [Streptomyces sp. NBC_01775]WSS14983.1 hypothetical protein OG533_26170 [Streptomyces sp. NBC_01186]WSS43827.1 hypothetical protein OG220_26985 [Streptomyces sp. NBC_01187]